MGVDKVLSGVWGVAVMEGVGVAADGVMIIPTRQQLDYFFQLMSVPPPHLSYPVHWLSDRCGHF